LRIFHSIRNRKTLTVVLFHRVLPVTDIRWKQADMDWTVSDVFYEDCLRFFKKYYNPVSLEDIERFSNEGVALPDHAILITFDDGWSDNYEYAAEINKRNNIKPLMFVTTSAIGTKILSWQESLYSAWRINKLPPDLIRQLASLINLKTGDILETETDIRTFINAFQNASSEIKSEVARLTETLTENLPGNNQMLSLEQLKALAETDFSMGTHGVIHEPYTQVKSALDDMQACKNQLIKITGQQQATSMSFPHGQKNDELIAKAVEAGYKTIFTGRTRLNKVTRQTTNVLGRFNIEQGDLESANGRLIPAEMALYLFKPLIE